MYTRRHFLFVTSAATASAIAYAAPTRPAIPRQNAESLKLEIQRAIDKGLEWLVKNQNEQGFWSTADHPALTSLALVALKGDPSNESRSQADRKKALDKGYSFVLSCVKDDGIYGKRELVNYNTSVALMALSVANNPAYESIIRKARANVIEGQYESGDQYNGGIGYGSSKPTPDISNTMHALEALHYSRKYAEDRGTGEDLNWDAAIAFIQNCQHLPDKNKAQWVSSDPAQKGGFIYSPEESKAGEVQESGRQALRAYASISYAGMLSYIYAGLKADDARVKAVNEWLAKNYTLEENPGMGAQGLYFYYHTMAKALTAAQIDTMKTVDGKNHNWREELTLKLLNLQKAEGFWANENARWWEKDPVLSTAYAVLSLEMIHRAL